ncbi:BRO family protein [Dietzia alimentaria]|uniref:BRO family protein n=1 Tax=Dietzia alimentaria TaxID=665550 RepID=UPI000299EF8D|nr:BRO family protein [Dietzia alimentaria]
MTHSTGTLVPFNYGAVVVRVISVDGEPWLVAADIARSLEYRDAHNLTRGLDADEKGTQIVSTPSGDQEMTVISESGFYTAALRSRSGRAADFRRWVTREVLPEIRRTGGYGAPKVDVEAVTRGDLARMVLAAEEEKSVLAAALESAAPAIAYHDRHIAKNSDLTLIEDWGRLVGLTKKEAFDTLVGRNIIFRKTIGSRWSAKAQRVVEEYEYRARAGRATTDWFELRPQHNAPRLHNGQVRQTLMVKVFYVDQLATKCGMSTNASLPIDGAVAS